MPTSAKRFIAALSNMRRPGGKLCDLLKAHHALQGRVVTMTHLAEAVHYRDYRSVNLQYGLLADRIAKQLGVKPPPIRLELLAALVNPKAQSNEQWQIVMRPEFAEALEQSGWLT